MNWRILTMCALAIFGTAVTAFAQDAEIAADSSFTMPVVFLFLSPLWWLLVLAASGAIVYFVHEEKGLFATGVLVATLLLMLAFGDMTLKFLWDNIHWTVGLIVGYVAVGALWGCGARWAIFLADVKLKYKEEMSEWLRSNNVAGANMPDGLKAEWRDYLLSPDSNWSYNTGEIIGDPEAYPPQFKREIRIVPSAWDHKVRITRWMVFWPWSMVWQAIDNLIWKVFHRIRVFASRKMDQLATYWFAGVENDYTIAPNDAPEGEPEDGQQEDELLDRAAE